MFLDLGIYERDIDKIIRIIGDNFDDAIDLKEKLIANYESFRGSLFLNMW